MLQTKNDKDKIHLCVYVCVCGYQMGWDYTGIVIPNNFPGSNRVPIKQLVLFASQE